MSHRFINKFKKINLDKSSIEIFLSILSKEYDNIALFTTSSFNNSTLKKNLLNINPSIQILEFPNFDCNFFSNISPTIENKSQRINTIYNLVHPNRNKKVLLCPIESLIFNTIDVNHISNTILKLNLINNLHYSEIIDFLKNNGYERVDFVHNKSEYSIRGEIIDIFSPIHEYPVRLVFDFEKLENMNQFLTENQLSLKQIDNYTLFLSSEIQFSDENIRCFRENFRKLNIINKDEYYKGISEKIIIPGSDQFFPILNNKFRSILDYMGNFLFITDTDFEEEFDSKLDSFSESHPEYYSHLIQDSNFLLQRTEFLDFFKNSTNLCYGTDNYNKTTYEFSNEFELRKNKNFNRNEIFKKISKNQKIVFCISSKTNDNKINSLLNANKVNFKKLNSLDSLIFKDEINFIFTLPLTLKSSFILKDNNSKEIYFVSDLDIYQKTFKSEVKKISKEQNSEELFSSLKIGDYIVHSEHGIGKYNGLKLKELNNVSQEFIEIIYYGDDKLLIPVENLDLISRYGQSDIKVNLDKLGLRNWQYRKATVKKRIKNIAEVLLKTAAERGLQKGEILIAKKFEYEKFSSEFEFTETSDQLKTIYQIEDDLSSGRPMDRLVCGDVGFGKTEIAMRAAFIAISSGFQVAIVCPKLLLVNQHFTNFKRRFQNFNYKIEKISRLESILKKKEIAENLEIGSIDILIGSHAIFSKKISFKKLGLIIIDEEQSFGVEQKESLKKIQPNSHILTLSATPIPRTLQSSIFELKDISLIKTPPLSRLNIKTFLMLNDKVQIKRIISEELLRNGQVFYVAPRISDLENISKKITKLIPNLKFEVIHGKLPNKKIESIYNNFSDRKIDVLISTAMIESGLDISNVNTIIIEKPQMFGLAQLYQLRGRVGRSSIQAFAYMLLNDLNNIDENSLKKLKLISKIDSLGAGFSIASSDLDMRGGGNIVGAEQSGHIREVGLELYYKMLKDAINNIKNTNNRIDKDWSPVINLGFSISIPKDYIDDVDVRLNIYRKISNIENSEELKLMLESLKDRFGKIPLSFQNLFKIIEVKIIAKEVLVKKINYSNKGFVLQFKDDKMINVDNLIKLVQKNSETLKILPDSKLFYKNLKSHDKNVVEDLKKLLLIFKKIINVY